MIIILIFCVVIIGIFLSFAGTNYKEKYEEERHIRFEISDSLTKKEKENRQLSIQNQYLSEKLLKQANKIEKIGDIELYAKTEKEKIEEKKQKADFLLNQAIKMYDEKCHDIRVKEKEILEQAKVDLIEYKRIVALAQSSVNTIEGMFDKYLIPDVSFFDMLAQKYSFDESGEQLRLAREKTKLIIENKLAVKSMKNDNSTLFFVESLFLDYFNTKVDLILKDAKLVNYNILKQKIIDAYNIVNHLANALESKITEVYLDARLDELSWIFRVNELIQRKRDEQRALREEERDRLKAKKEAEKALIKTQKEINTLKEEIERLTNEIKNISDPKERESIRKKIRKNEEKLKEREGFKTRVKSVAEFGRQGFVYIISNKGSFGENIFKIGMTRRLDPEIRINELFTSSIPFPFDIHAVIETSDAPLLEKKLHNAFVLNRVNKVNHYKEFFNVSCLEIKKVVEDMGLKVQWTIEALSQQYQESMKIDKMINENYEYQKQYIAEWERKIIEVTDIEEEIDEI